MHDAAMVGKSRHERIENDFYATPAWCTEALAKMGLLGAMAGTFWEPACGDGAIASVLESYDRDVHSTDLVDRGYGTGGVDFLKQTEMMPGTRNIITNPPYGKHAEDFLRHALTLTEEPAGWVAFFLRNEFDSAKKRMDIFQNPRFFCKLVLTKRPMWIKGTTGSPRHNYSWFVFTPLGSYTPAHLSYYSPTGASL